MVIVSRLWQISNRPPGESAGWSKGGETMVLRLYHIEKEPVTVFNIIKFSLGDNRQISVRVKEKSSIRTKWYNYEKDYQRLTVQVD